MMGYDFHRQKPLGNYIVDFFCNELMLVIEIDGDSHNDSTYDYDDKRQKELEEFDLTFLRFYDGHVKNYLGDVVNSIKEWIKEQAPKS
jgi:very-short-patch-repair endonuclease